MGVSGEGVYHARSAQTTERKPRLVSRRSFESPTNKPVLLKGLATGILCLMRPPQSQIENLGFLFEDSQGLLAAMGDHVDAEQTAEIVELFDKGLPPVTSQSALATMLGYNPGFVWSLLNRTSRHYRQFSLRKGDGFRDIDAPKVGLKAIQKWLSYHFQRSWQPIDNVYGFVPGKSHIKAAEKHLSAEWVFSVDIENFFPSISNDRVMQALTKLGYETETTKKNISQLVCLRLWLVQGAPTSPVLSNIVLDSADRQLAELSDRLEIRFTRYADDIVFSGRGDVPANLTEQVKEILVNDGWVLSKRKESLSALPERLKVHGLLVHGERLRLTKGYRNRIRAYKYLTGKDAIKAEDRKKIEGHLKYAELFE